MNSIFRSAEFYSPDAVRTQIKSPVQWLVQTSKILETSRSRVRKSPSIPCANSARSPSLRPTSKAGTAARPGSLPRRCSSGTTWPISPSATAHCEIESPAQTRQTTNDPGGRRCLRRPELPGAPTSQKSSRSKSAPIPSDWSITSASAFTRTRSPPRGQRATFVKYVTDHGPTLPTTALPRAPAPDDEHPAVPAYQ